MGKRQGKMKGEMGKFKDHEERREGGGRNKKWKLNREMRRERGQREWPMRESREGKELT